MRASRTRRGGRRGAALALALGAAAVAPWVPVVVPAARAGALDADAAAGAVKVCSPLDLARWRSVTPVPSTWTFLDCMGFAGDMGASHFQLGCLFAEVTPYAQKYAWGAVVKVEPAALAGPQAPVPNCGW